ncbi:homoprotocatechuate degradation operon regulator HpaR [Marinovum sp.]|uniref:homoprotocatechuate degradation operon regulator HpaR n=1 Tax=Marinovum sp. TaxID=2024839 RepID=UPI002B27BB5F|nr:homoprotocatechuate degradation operon regulator HpaR [Marinovum sp.]
MPNSLPETARSLPIAIVRAREGVMAPVRDMLSATGLTEQQWRVLRVLSECGPMDSTSLADRASLLFPSLTRIGTTLNKSGLVTQTRDSTDRRKQIVAITPAGQQIIDRHADQAALIIESYKARLGDRNYETLLDLLALLDPGRPG